MLRIYRRCFSTKKIPLLFPGQGSQYVGMGSSRMPDLFTIASEIIGYDLENICQNGPAEVLNSTKFAQVAIFVSCMAGLKTLKESAHPLFEDHKPTISMGNSLGEYSALCFGNVFSFEDGVKLTFARGVEMDKCCKMRAGKMVSITGVEINTVDLQCKLLTTSNEVVCIANILSPSACVISGA